MRGEFTVAQYKQYVSKLESGSKSESKYESKAESGSKAEAKSESGAESGSKAESKFKYLTNLDDPDDEIIDHSAMDIACFHGDVKLVTILINYSECYFSGSCAVKGSRPETLEILLQHGKCSREVLTDACRSNQTDLIRLMFRYMDPQCFREQCLVVAIKDKNIYLIDYLLEKGIILNQGYYTPLIAACKMKDLTTVHKLLLHGADPNYGGHMDGSKNPIECACSRNCLEIVQTLIGFGAEPTEECFDLTILPEILVLLAKNGGFITTECLASFEDDCFYALLPYVSKNKAIRAACCSKLSRVQKLLTSKDDYKHDIEDDVDKDDSDWCHDNYYDYKPYSLLSYCIFSKSESLVILDYVLSLGFDPDDGDTISNICCLEEYSFDSDETKQYSQLPERTRLALDLYDLLISYGPVSTPSCLDETCENRPYIYGKKSWKLNNQLCL